MLVVMSGFDSTPFPDEVPEADAVEQTRPAVEPGEPLPVDDDAQPPLESDESDWQEQREVVESFDDDEFR